MRLVLSAAVFTAGAIAMIRTIRAGDPVPVELGRVPWERDYDSAAGKAKTSGKPLLVLFQEIPG